LSDKETRNAIERATQRARKLIENDFSAQLEGTFDVLRDGTVAPKAGSHLSPRQVFERDKIVAAIEHKRTAGMSAAEAVVDYLRDAAFTISRGQRDFGLSLRKNCRQNAEDVDVVGH
jgi:hypothetical protein